MQDKSIDISRLRQEDIGDFISVMLNSFEDKFMPAFSGNRQAAVNIVSSEIEADLASGSYYAAGHNGELAGLLIIKTVETAKKSSHINLKIYFRQLGFFKALKALLVLFIENLFRVKADELYIDTLAVRKKFRGMGIAKKLLQFAQQLAEQAGKRKLVLAVVEKNSIAINLYKSFGFKVYRKYSLLINEGLMGYRVFYIMRKNI